MLLEPPHSKPASAANVLQTSTDERNRRYMTLYLFPPKVMDLCDAELERAFLYWRVRADLGDLEAYSLSSTLQAEYERRVARHRLFQNPCPYFEGVPK